MLPLSFIITAVIAGGFAWSAGLASNGMTSPRQAFNIMIPLISVLVGAVIGVFANMQAVVNGPVLEIVTGVLANGAVGLVCGLVVLCGVRLVRGR